MTKKATVLLIVPPHYSVPHAQFNLERIGLGYLASLLRQDGHIVRILDGVIEDVNWAAIVNKVNSLKPDLIGLSLMSHDGLTELEKPLSEIKNKLPNIHICLGGTFPSLNWKKIFKKILTVDTIVCGDGEFVFRKLIRAILQGRSIHNIEGLATRDGLLSICKLPIAGYSLDDLPFPERDQLPIVLSNNGPASVLSSRGCYGRCSFCALHAIQEQYHLRGIRYRTGLNTVDEIETVYKRYNARKFYFLDENFIGSGKKGKKRALEIASEIRRRKIDIAFSLECRCNDVELELFEILRDSGLQRVFIGVESTEQSELNLFKKEQETEDINNAIKILKQLGVHIEIGFMLFTPWSTLKSISRKRKFLESFGPQATASLGSYLSVVPGSKMVGQLKKLELLRGQWPDYHFDFQDRRASILFGLVWRELVEPWNRVIQELLTYQWNQPYDWSIKHALERKPNGVLSFIDELTDWISERRFEIFDSLYDIVKKLSIPKDIEESPLWAVDKLKNISDNSRQKVAEVSALLEAASSIKRKSENSIVSKS